MVQLPLYIIFRLLLPIDNHSEGIADLNRIMSVDGWTSCSERGKWKRR